MWGRENFGTKVDRVQLENGYYLFELEVQESIFINPWFTPSPWNGLVSEVSVFYTRLERPESK